MRRTLRVLAPVVAVAAVAWWVWARKSAPVDVPVARAARERLVSTLATNGKVEPLEWRAVRAERGAAVRNLHVHKGARVTQGALLVELDAGAAQADLAAAESRMAQARAELDAIDSGGRPAERVELENSLAAARLELEEARKNHEALVRLAEKNAATREEADQARQRVERAELLIRSLDKRRAALATPTDRAAAQARWREAEAAAETARRALAQSVIRAPMAGVVYDLEVRPGAYLNPGDMAARIGRTDTLRLLIYVDEPELGRVSPGMPLVVTWDARPGREWRSRVDRVATEIVALGTRQVGEVTATVENAGGELPPGANVNVAIQSRVVDNALTIPKEALRRQDNQTGVYVVENARLVWRPVETGVSSVTRIEVVKGLAAGDLVVLATDAILRPGLAVRIR